MLLLLIALAASSVLVIAFFENCSSCYTYKRKGSDACTSHYIRECILDDVVLEDLRRVTAMAREHTREFAEYIGSKQPAEIQREIRRLEKELVVMRKRSAELGAIFKKLYEDQVLNQISVEQFQVLSDSYAGERASQDAGIPEKESSIQRLFIQKIVVHEKSAKYSKHAEQTIEIYYTDIGFIGETGREEKPQQEISA